MDNKNQHNYINNLNYDGLVRTLQGPLTPQVRKLILDKLTLMNNQLLEPKQNFDLDSLIDDVVGKESSIDKELDRDLARISQLYYYVYGNNQSKQLKKKNN